MTETTPDTSILVTAARHLCDGKPDSAMQALNDDSRASGLGQLIALAANGLIAEQAGDHARAARCFDEVQAAGVPIPDLLLVCGRYFKRNGDHARAFHNYVLLWNLQPQAMVEFLRDLPAKELAAYSPWRIPQLLLGARPNLYGLPPVKDALTRQLGVSGAAIAYAQMAGFGADARVATLPLEPLGQHARRQGWPLDVIVPSREIVLSPPSVFGKPPTEGIRTRTREFFLCIVPDVLVSSKSNVLLRQDVALLDVQDDELTKAPIDLRVDPIVMEHGGGTVTVNVGVPESDPLPQAFDLTGLHSHAFGHWILEFLPKVWACIDRPGFASVPVLVDERMPHQHRESLAFFLGDDHPVIALAPIETHQVRQLWTCSMITYMPPGSRPGAAVAPDATTLDARGFTQLLGKFRAKLDAVRPHPETGKRLYLARRQNQHRRLVNDREVQEWAIANGFRIVDFTDMSFGEQLALVHGADLILGPHGSAFMMAFFARVGTRIGILNNHHLIDFEWYTDVFQQLGMPHGILVGETVREDRNYGFFSDYRIDMARLGSFVDSLAESD